MDHQRDREHRHKAGGKDTGQRALKVKRGMATLVVDTDCAAWSLVTAVRGG